MKFTSVYDPEIKAAAEKYWPGIDWLWWKAQLYQESLLNPDAVSYMGARGIAQFMPKTWKSVCKKLRLGDASPHDPELAIKAGAFYMAGLVRGWSSPRPAADRWDLARASYNAGFGNLLKAQKIAGGALLYADIIAALPEVTGSNSIETMQYVQKIHWWYGEMK